LAVRILSWGNFVKKLAICTQDIVAAYVHNSFNVIKVDICSLRSSLENGPVSVNAQLSSALPHIGGGRPSLFSLSDLQPYLRTKGLVDCTSSSFTFVDHVSASDLSTFPVSDGYVAADVPLLSLVKLVPVKMIHKIAKCHKIALSSHVPKIQMPSYFDGHNCLECKQYLSIFKSTSFREPTKNIFKARKKDNLKTINSDVKLSPVKVSIDTLKPTNLATLTSEEADAIFNASKSGVGSAPYPPPPLSATLTENIIRDFCAASGWLCSLWSVNTSI
jgi:hypothetical protein